MANRFSDAAKEKFLAGGLMPIGPDGVEPLHVRLHPSSFTTSFPSWAVQRCKLRGFEIGWGIHKEFDKGGMPIQCFSFNSTDSKGKRATGKIFVDEFTIAANSQSNDHLEAFLDSTVIAEGIKQVQKVLIESGKPDKVTVVVTDPKEDEVNRKIKIARTPVRKIDPKKVKKPPCPLHPETKMEYDAVTEKWRCQVPGCKQVATPRAKAEDKSVTFGTGKIQVRLMYTDDGKPHVILIADNNVALEVTDMVDIAEIEDIYDISASVILAKSNGKSEFHVPLQKEIPFKASLYVMGSENYKKD